MRIKAFKIGKSKEKTDEEPAVAEDNATIQEPAMDKEPVNNNTSDQEKTENKQTDLDDIVNAVEKEAVTPRPHGPINELSVEETDELQYDDSDVGVLTDDSGEEEEIKLVEMTGKEAAPAEKSAGPKIEDASDSLSNLFDDEEEEENPLAALISALPDVTPQELLDDLQEIQDIINEQQQK